MRRIGQRTDRAAIVRGPRVAHSGCVASRKTEPAAWGAQVVPADEVAHRPPAWIGDDGRRGAPQRDAHRKNLLIDGLATS
jgi:hypothetical protein